MNKLKRLIPRLIYDGEHGRAIEIMYQAMLEQADVIAELQKQVKQLSEYNIIENSEENENK